MKKLVLLDSNSLIHRAFYALPPLSDSKGRYTNAIYGFMSMLVRIIKELKPTHMVAAFDLKGPTFRHKMYDKYKATRKPMADELASQIPLLKDLIREMGIAIVELEGYEADDIIGTLAKKTHFDTVVVSGDRDNLQLVSKNTRVWFTKKGISNVEELDLISLGAKNLTPDMIIEVKSLMGDSSDNIPGVPGVGEKTALALLSKYETLDGVYTHIEEIKGKLKERLIENKELAYLSKELATIDTNVPFDYDIRKYEFRYPFKSGVKKMLEELEIRRLISRFEYDEDIEKHITKAEIIEISTINEIKILNENILGSGVMAIDYGVDKIHIAYDKNKEYIIIPSDDLLGELRFDEIKSALSESLKSNNVKKIAFDYKNLKYKLDINGLYQDLMLKSYVVGMGFGFDSVERMLEAYGMCGDCLAVELFKINELLEQKLIETKTNDLYYNIELPLVDVLYDMEKIGFRVDREILEELSSNLCERLDLLTSQIYSYSDREFNINSTRQLGEVLFDQLKLPSLKKNKTGYSLSYDVLHKMRSMHPIIDLIIEYRHIAKLISTYIEGIRNQVGSDGRVHTIFKQAATTTGRLSSTEPNLQNIPIRDEIGKKIRKMFVASVGNTLTSADYSQIELRLLAHFSSDEKLVQSYLNDEDVHSRTAAEIFEVDIKDVTPDMRRKAKAVNFGIIYGISSFGLSENINITVNSAKIYIDKYFQTYPKVKEFMDNSIALAKESGKIRTITGRLRAIPELKSSNYNIRSFGERAAMNMPLQGSSADIIKIAMINVYNRLRDEGLKSRLILQIHDELVIDTYPNEKERIMEILTEEMEGAVALRVPIMVDIKNGYSLYEA